MHARTYILGVVVALPLVLSLSKDEPHAQRKPNVVLVTLDTTRADRMGFLGSTRGLTPSLAPSRRPTG